MGKYGTRPSALPPMKMTGESVTLRVPVPQRAAPRIYFGRAMNTLLQLQRQNVDAPRDMGDFVDYYVSSWENAVHRAEHGIMYSSIDKARDVSALIRHQQLEVEAANPDMYNASALAARMAPMGIAPSHYSVILRPLSPVSRKEKRAMVLRDAEAGLELELQRMTTLSRRIEDALSEARAIYAARDSSPITP